MMTMMVMMVMMMMMMMVAIEDTPFCSGLMCGVCVCVYIFGELCEPHRRTNIFLSNSWIMTF